MFNELTEMILSVENDIMEQDYDIDEVLNANNIHNDMDMVLFAMRFLLANVYEAMIEGNVNISLDI
jgi:hypothetical protein